MKLFFQVIFLSLSFYNLKAQGKIFQLEGSLTNMPFVAKVYINYISPKGHVKDSSDVVDGVYAFAGSLREPQDIKLTVSYFPDQRNKQTSLSILNGKDQCRIYMSSGSVRVHSVDSFSNITVSGSAWHKDFVYLQQLLDENRKESNIARKEWDEANAVHDTATMQRVVREGTKKIAPLLKKLLNYAQTHRNSPLSIWVLRVCANGGSRMGAVLSAYNNLAPDIKALPSGRDLEHYIKFVAATDIGKPAPAFALADTSGQKLSLSSLKGKYVLIDFWASWCQPCRAETPYITSLYNKYHNNGFTVLSVTSPRETNSETWKDAIQKDNMNWYNVWDKNGDVSKLYNVDAVPRNFLLDKNGIIVAKDLRGDALVTRMKELLGD
jgi:thiol-disulfide isomerase/thioredoxin